MAQVKEKVFILKKIQYGEADLILKALTPSGARISLFARSALKSRKRFGGGILEPTHFLNVLYDDKAARSEHALNTLKEAELVNGFEGLRADYSRLELALRFVQLVHDLSREGETNSSEVFNLLGNALRAAETTTAPERLLIHFETKLLFHHGVLAVGEEEARLLRAAITDHERVEMSEGAWSSTGGRVRSALHEYLPTPFRS